ncbi:hypothetical protein FDT66_10250 [Polaribacter aestuariivivens]|uniref:Secreted protein n=1 Tax=Polaribacter aestuariivivens TaxID=2304626 RepID=A0A5S3N9D3_9FLAO|nr:hypothetical protein [Polaribacter aestuariivivens]TMM29496.1 hypothetical protein FDT66_10250 [Polaribacter aestuariivivens]
MKKNILFLMAVFFVSFYSNSQQKEINNYKYIIVSDKFDFVKEKDQYQTSSLTKFLLKKNGFEVLLESEEYPEDLKSDRCAALFATVIDESTMFKSRLAIQLKDCFNKVVYTSGFGESREKEYKKSYQLAIRNAHKNMSEMVYTPLPKNEKVIQKDVKVHTPQVVTKVIDTDVSQEILKKNDTGVKKIPSNILYAQVNENGYQLVNTKPEVLFLLLDTNVKDVFIIKDKNGILYKKNTVWIAEYYTNEKLIVEEYQVKF